MTLQYNSKVSLTIEFSPVDSRITERVRFFKTFLGVMSHHFVLIHGGFHGAWAWAKTVDRLQKAGCKATAMDLAIAGNDSTDPDTITTWSEYHKPAVDLLASLPDDEKMLKDTLIAEAITFNFGNGADRPPTSLSIQDKYLPEVMYNGCSSEDIKLASTLLKWFPVQGLGTPIVYTKERHGQVPAVFVKNLRDNTMVLRAQNFVIENCGPFKEVVEVDGGHFSVWRCSYYQDLPRLKRHLKSQFFKKNHGII